MGRDLRYGARILGRNAGFTIAAILTLALGIGVNVAAFTAYKAFFHRGLDARDATQMVNLATVHNSEKVDYLFSYPDYEAYRDHLQSFSGLIAEAPGEVVNLSDGDSDRSGISPPGWLGGLISTGTSNKRKVTASIVSNNYFSVLGIAPLHGRTFGSPSELATSPEVVISENYWRERFGGDLAVLGRTVRLNGADFAIVGIMPHDFAGTGFEVPPIWLPISVEHLVEPNGHWINDREDFRCRLFGRLARGGSMDKAQAEITLLAGQLRALHQAHSDWSKPAAALVWPGSPIPIPLDRLAGSVKYAVLLVMFAVALVLLIACANVASLQLARATSRRSELSMRLSLGASRSRLVSQLLTESALMGLLAGLVGLMFSWILTKELATLAGKMLPETYGALIFHVTPDLGILLYVLAVSLASGILFGLAPALESSQGAISSAIHANAGTSPVRSRRLRDSFIAGQVAVALALLIAASMLIHSSIHALHVDTGYDIKHIVDIELPNTSTYTAGQKAELVRRLGTQLSALPGVVSITHAAPPIYGYRQAALSLNAELPSAKNKSALLHYTYVQANYFDTLGIRLLIGRNFPPQGGQAEPAVILSESAAKQLWPGKNALGRTLRLGTDGLFHHKDEMVPDGPLYQVIGIAGDTRGATFDGSDSRLAYLQLPEDRLQDYSILMRTEADPKQAMPAIFPLISSLDPALQVNASRMADAVRLTPTVFLPSFAAAIASPVGLIALLLAAMGIYGTVSYIVVLRTREVGLRIALGAQKQAILALMLQQAMRPVLGGLIAGICLALGASYLLRGALHGLGLVDSISFFGISALFLGTAVFAAYLPSRRAMSVDPIVALRCE